jgi:hypothetical protein
MANNRTENELLIDINNKLEKLIGLFAIQGKSKEDQILILTKLGLSNSEISTLTGIPKGTVDSTRAKAKKR